MWPVPSLEEFLLMLSISAFLQSLPYILGIGCVVFIVCRIRANRKKKHEG